MNRFDVRRVDLLNRRAEARLFDGIRAAQGAVQLPAYAVAELPGRLLGEGDRDDLSQLGPRPTSTDVLPVPAPACRKIDVSRSRCAASRTA
jgi:hypothetical protein